MVACSRGDEMENSLRKPVEVIDPDRGWNYKQSESHSAQSGRVVGLSSVET